LQKSPIKETIYSAKETYTFKELLIVATSYKYTHSSVSLRSLLQKSPIKENRYFAKEIYNLKEPTNRSHPIHIYSFQGITEVSFAKEPYKRDYILQKRPTI